MSLYEEVKKEMEKEKEDALLLFKKKELKELAREGSRAASTLSTIDERVKEIESLGVGDVLSVDSESNGGFSVLIKNRGHFLVRRGES